MPANEALKAKIREYKRSHPGFVPVHAIALDLRADAGECLRAALEVADEDHREIRVAKPEVTA